MKRLSLLVVLAATLSSCALPSLLSGGGASLPVDPRGATFTRQDGPNYSTLTFLPGNEAVQEAVAHLTGPALRVNDDRCVVEGRGLACTFGTVAADGKRVIYVFGLSDGRVDGVRADGSPVHVGLR